MSAQNFRKKALGPFFWLFLLRKLPLAFLAGVKLKKLDDSGSMTQMKFRWINQNPFRSMYFAAMHMAAEFATGALLFQYMDSKTRFSMLLVNTSAEFHKKAVGKISFTCAKGPEADTFIEQIMNSEEGDAITLPVSATNAEGEVVANFQYVWSCRRKK